MYFICEKCGDVCEETDLPIYSENHYTLSGEHLGSEEMCDCCHCGGDYVEARECPVCKEIISADYDLCEDCLKKNCTLENCIGMGEDAKDECEINGFLLYVFSPREIFDCLLKRFENLPKDMQDEYIKAYCEDDTSFLAGYLERKGEKNADLH